MDGKADASRVPIEVTVSNPGTWPVVPGRRARLEREGDGGTVVWARVINVDVRAQELLFVEANGVFEVTNLVLADSTDLAPRFAAQIDSLGRTGPFRLSEITLPRDTNPCRRGSCCRIRT